MGVVVNLNQYTESVVNGLDYLASIREKTDTPEARMFFNKVLALENKTKSGLPAALKLWLSVYGKSIMVTQEYVNRVLNASNEIYDILFDKQLKTDPPQRVPLENYPEDKTEGQINVFCFHLTVIFMYCALTINNSEQLENLIYRVKEKIRKPAYADNTSIGAMVFWLMGIVFLILGFLKMQFGYFAVSITFSIVSLFFSIYRLLRMWTAPRVLQHTGDLV